MKDKALKIVAAVLAATTVVSAAAFFLTKDKNPSGKPSENDAVIYSYDNSEFTKTVSVKGTNGEIFLPTDF